MTNETEATYPTHCWNIRNLCEDDNCECGRVMEKVKYAESITDYCNRRTIGELTDNPEFGKAIVDTKEILKWYVRDLMDN